jgi:hypothetical protein
MTGRVFNRQLESFARKTSALDLLGNSKLQEATGADASAERDD